MCIAPRRSAKGRERTREREMPLYRRTYLIWRKCNANKRLMNLRTRENYNCSTSGPRATMQLADHAPNGDEMAVFQMQNRLAQVPPLARRLERNGTDTERRRNSTSCSIAAIRQFPVQQVTCHREIHFIFLFWLFSISSGCAARLSKSIETHVLNTLFCFHPMRLKRPAIMMTMKLLIRKWTMRERERVRGGEQGWERARAEGAAAEGEKNQIKMRGYLRLHLSESTHCPNFNNSFTQIHCTQYECKKKRVFDELNIGISFIVLPLTTYYLIHPFSFVRSSFLLLNLIKCIINYYNLLFTYRVITSHVKI